MTWRRVRGVLSTLAQLAVCVGALCMPLWLPGCIAKATAAPLTSDQARGILYVTYGQFHGPRSLIEDPPLIRAVKKAELCEKLGHPHPECGAAAVYMNGESTVLVDDTLDFNQPSAAAILVHEFVHHFQWKLRGMPRSCGEMVARERQAYLIQAAILERIGRLEDAYLALKGGMLHMPYCPVDGSLAPEWVGL